MAKEEAAAVEVEQPKVKGGGKKMLLIIVAVVLLVAATVVALLLFMPSEETDAKHEAEVAVEDEHPPVYEKLDSFTVNLADGESYLQVEINLKIADATVGEKIKLHMPEIKDGILRLLSSQSAEELATVEGKDRLANAVQKVVNETLGIKTASSGVLKVLFPAFIIQ